ncbi:unnamed protein product [Diamesa serratosioi]
MLMISSNFREFNKAAIFTTSSILIATKIIVFWLNEEKIFKLIRELQDFEKYDETNRIAKCNGYISMLLKLSLLVISFGDSLVYLVVSMFGRSEYRLVLPWLFEINCDLMYYIIYVIQVIQAIIIIPVYISIETLPFGLMLLLEAHIENIGEKVAKIGWEKTEKDTGISAGNNECLSTVLPEDEAKRESLNIINVKDTEKHNEYYQEDGAVPSTSTGISTTSRDYMINSWHTRECWGPSPENSDDSDNEDKAKETCKDVLDLVIQRRIIYDEFIKPRNSFVRYNRGVCQPSTFVMPTKPIKSENRAFHNKPKTSMEDLLKHCIDYQVKIFKYTYNK